MEEHDLLVIGGGAANNVAAAASDAGLDVGLVERDRLGGTCLNRGCNPSKILIQTAKTANAVRDSERFGVRSELEGVEVSGVVGEMSSLLGGVADSMEQSYRDDPGVSLYLDDARFVDDRTVEVGGRRLRGDRVVVATGSRPTVPPIDGLDDVDPLTSDDVLYMEEPPDSVVALGGGYVSCELGYYLDSVGVDVSVVESGDRLLSREDPEVADHYTSVADERHDLYLGYRGVAVEDAGDGVVVHAESADGDSVEVGGDSLLLAVGRTPNTDGLGLDETGVDLDDRGFVETDGRLRTTADDVYAMGDVAGNAMYKHAADNETDVVVDNVLHGVEREVDYAATPHAVFGEPEVAGVGATEPQLRRDGDDYVVGRARYEDSAMGRARKLEGLVKVLAASAGEVLGCHVVGAEASTLVHEASTAMRHGLSADAVASSIHAHPTLSRVVEAAFEDAAREASA